jgi:dolichol-phosphate mannosyltransferase
MTIEARINGGSCKTFALVVPTLNEAANIVKVLDRAREALCQLPLAWEILVVDDESTDGTAEAVLRYSVAHPEIRLVERHSEKGLAGAITYGWGNTDADVLGVMDADLQHPPELLPELVSRVCRGTDIAIASRYLRVDSMAAWNLPRRMISRLSVLARKPVQRSGLRVSDPMSGFFVLRRECIAGMEFQPAGFKLLLEILAKGHIRSVAEIPFKFGPRTAGKSKANAMTAVYYFSLLCRLSREMAFGQKNAERSEAKDSLQTPNARKTVEEPLPSRTQRTRSLEVILGLLPLVLGLQLLIWLVYLPAALRGNADFRNCYSTGLLLVSGRGHQIYDYEVQHKLQDAFVSQTPTGMPYVHPPYEALLFVPFSFLTYRGAFLCWLGLNVVCLLVSYRILRGRLWRLDEAWRWLPFLFFIGFIPVTVALMQGQDSLITLLFLSTALISLESGNDLLAGFMVGLAAYKFQLVVPIGCLFFLWRRWRFVCGTCLSALAAIVVSGFIAGTENLLSYVGYVRETAIKFAVLMPEARMPNLRGLLSLLHLRPGISTSLVLILSLAVMALAGWSARKSSVDWQFSIAISAAVLVGYHVRTHDLSILLVPMAMILGERGTTELWTIPMLWLSTTLCIFAHDPLVALPLLGLFLFLAQRLQRPVVKWPGSTPVDLSDGTLA